MLISQLVPLLKRQKYFPSAPTGRWFGGAGSGTSWKDISGNNNHGTFVGSPVWTQAGPRQNRYGIRTAAGTDLLNCGSPTLFDDMAALSIVAWVYTTNITGEQQIVAKISNPIASGWCFVLETGTGKPTYFRFGPGGNNDLRSTSAVPANAWTHVAMVLPTMTSNVSFYINGVVTGATSAGGFTPSSDAASNLTIAGREGDTSGLIGTIDDVGVFNRALTADEILALAQAL
jgi:hypothetical protein